jgi:adenosylcobinamide kinase/adenosylcobinamide-phosphate guanylyltransferase
MSMTFILGGARSGKSRFAQELASKLKKRVLFVATCEPLDEEMSARIKVHQRSRPRNWKTLETPTDVAKTMKGKIGDAEIVIIDCLTLLVSNLMGTEDIDAETLEKKVTAELEDLIVFIRKKKAHFIIVSNEVGLGLVPPYPGGRVYRDALGMANQMLARNADEVYFMIAGIPIPLKALPKQKLTKSGRIRNRSW